MADTEEEEENYWPGYVDALSTMTMVLTFVMMILVVIVFQLIQNTSTAVLKRVVEQADIGSGGATNTVESLSKLLIDVITKAREQGNPSVATTDEVKKQNENIQSVSVEKQEETKSEEQAEVKELGDEVAVTVSQTALVLEFQPQSTKLNEAAKQQIGSFGKTSDLVKNGKTLEIIGFADVSGGKVSDERRIAYYRAMVARSELIQAGVDPALINVGIRDSDDPQNKQKVRIYGR